MSVALTLYALTNDVETSEASDAYDAIVRGLPGGPERILDELAEVGVLPVGSAPDDLAEAREQIVGLEQERNDATSEARSAREETIGLERTVTGLEAQVDKLTARLERQTEGIERVQGGEAFAEVFPVVETRWVKTTSHRGREQLLRAFRFAGLDEPQAWFRKPGPNSKGWLRQDGEYWEVPTTIDVSRVSGATVLKRGVPREQRFRPTRW
jgi:hypothetical protein